MHNELIEFLITAKKNTYAAKAVETLPSRPESHDLRFESGKYLYIDTYLGGEKFAGEEAVWENGSPVWVMNYAGRVTGDGFSGDFLKAALMSVPREAPYRGAKTYSDGQYLYECDVDGDFEWFNGHEEISVDGNKIYECIYNGGIIK